MDGWNRYPAARRLGMRTSALRYYEQRGLVRPAGRARGQRVYGRPELRRLAFVQIAQRLGIPWTPRPLFWTVRASGGTPR